VSVNLEGKGLGSKVEVKNLNSFKFVRKAISYEIERQTEILERGGSVTQETRLWNENRDVTEGMRTKESSSDYRYFPEPDLPPFVPDKGFLDKVEKSLVELPQARRLRFLKQFSLTEEQADFLCDEKATADYFEETVRLGADPQSAALWMASDVKKHLNRTGSSLVESPLSARRLAEMLGLLASKRIHGRIAKAVLEKIFEEDKDPLVIIREKSWEQITDPVELGAHVDSALRAHEGIVASIRAGDNRLITFLIGEIMKETSGRADPALVQDLVKKKLAVSVVQILSLGGAIVGRESEQGDVVAGDPGEIMRLVEAEGHFGKKIAFEEGEVGRILSEEITPGDWARLVSGLDEHLRSGRASGIVVTHGTDTLAYTASLVFWLFPQPPVPIVLAASLSTASRPGSDAIPSLRKAIQIAAEGLPGVYVVFGGKVFSPLNLKFERMTSDGFHNWNMKKLCHTAGALFDDLSLGGDREKLRARLEGAINSTLIIRVYPGMRGDHLIELMDRGVKNFVLELYDTGTANLRDSPYSLRRVFLAAREKGVHFFCTSQQEGIVDFSRYATSHELWREGAIPMGPLTTESAWTKLVVCLAFSDTEEEMLSRMEQENADACL
jgi:aspartyl-tRNA(Asn)/glutamyl-tRNA(Gln) amidotransferase subunit B